MIFPGDHKQMFPHLGERIIMASDKNKAGGDGSGGVNGNGVVKVS